MAKIIAIILGGLLVISNAAWGYFMIEKQVHISYLAGDIQDVKAQKRTFREMCNHIYSGLDITQAKEITVKFQPDEVLFVKDGALVARWYSLELTPKEEKLIERPCSIW